MEKKRFFYVMVNVLLNFWWLWVFEVEDNDVEESCEKVDCWFFFWYYFGYFDWEYIRCVIVVGRFLL